MNLTKIFMNGVIKKIKNQSTKNIPLHKKFRIKMKIKK